MRASGSPTSTSARPAPYRSSLLSGKHEFKNGITHTINERERMSLKTTTLAQVLKSAGYTTASSASGTSATPRPISRPARL